MLGLNKKAHKEVNFMAWLQLARTERIGPITFKKLLAKFGAAEAALEALPELSKIGGKSYKPVDQSIIEKELTALNKINGDIMIWSDALFPEQLKAIEDAPVVLSYIGNPELISQKQIGIVGSRNASLNGRKFTFKLAKQLSDQNIVVTSGMARGIDTAAHEGALDKGTVAVLAGGIDQIYPKENTNLYNEICIKGCVIAECAYGTAPSAHLFPRRNRIVSGLSQGVLVVEATERSGSLITARLANEQGRDVMAVPGYPADPRATGANKLIREGATLVRHVEDVLEQLDSPFSGHRGVVSEETEQQEMLTDSELKVVEDMRDKVLDQITTQAIGIDELTRACHVSVSEMQTTLLALELAGRIQRLPGNRVCRLEE